MHVIRERYAKTGYAPRARVIPTWVLGVASLFSGQVGSLYSKLGQPNVCETKWPDVYRYQYRDFDQIVTDSMDSMLAHGWLKPKRVDGRARPSFRTYGDERLIDGAGSNRAPATLRFEG